MDTRTGVIRRAEDMAGVPPEFVQPVDVDKLNDRLRRQVYRRGFAKVGRNDKCPCGRTDEHGNRRKFKRCCMDRRVAEETKNRAVARTDRLERLS